MAEIANNESKSGEPTLLNVTAVTRFILGVFSDVQEIQTLCGVLFLVMYLAALMSNFIIITLISLDLQLQTPMYFFLKNLSLLDVFFVTVPIPNFIVNSLTHNSSISILGCALQILFFVTLITGDLFVLTAMSYDGYVAICCPLQYDTIMSDGACVLMAGFSWATGLFLGAIYTAGTFSMPFCGSNVIPQFFCDIPSLLRISCSGTLVVIYTSFGIGMCLCMSCFICVVISYFYIFSTVLKIPTTKGQSKAFATCLSHLTVFTIFIATAYFVYLKTSSNSAITDRLFAVIYTVLPPALNPVICSLKNADVKCALRRLLQDVCSRGSFHVTLKRA
ncbi:olfactory receptor 14A2-like [Nannospalax galili]|uniref:olfactory receptor 14A2-like n=1 Tax=Nannospalax galili TaxID=1026970 RepID=UPI0004ED2658|nr:olfactory receptor 14A2-like [Nannospalax galili]